MTDLFKFALCFATLFPASLAAQTPCKRVHEISSIALQLRHVGVPVIEAMRLGDQLPDPLAELHRSATLAAYDAPAFRTEQMQTQMIRDHGNKYYVECRKSGFQ